MKQMTIIEVDDFLKGKCIPRDLKVNETNTEYLVRKFGELESKLETALRECRSAGITIDNLEAKCAALAADNEKAMEAMRQADSAVKLAHEKFSAMAAENAMLKKRIEQIIQIINNADNEYCMCGSAMKDHVHSGCGHPTGTFDYHYNQWLDSDNKTTATDAFLAEVRAQCLNAFIQHHSAELDAHIKNGGDQFDEKSVRIRDIIVSARLFREQISKGGNQ